MELTGATGPGEHLPITPDTIEAVPEAPAEGSPEAAATQQAAAQQTASLAAHQARAAGTNPPTSTGIPAAGSTAPPQQPPTPPGAAAAAAAGGTPPQPPPVPTRAGDLDALAGFVGVNPTTSKWSLAGQNRHRLYVGSAPLPTPASRAGRRGPGAGRVGLQPPAGFDRGRHGADRCVRSRKRNLPNYIMRFRHHEHPHSPTHQPG